MFVPMPSDWSGVSRVHFLVLLRFLSRSVGSHSWILPIATNIENGNTGALASHLRL